MFKYDHIISILKKMYDHIIWFIKNKYKLLRKHMLPIKTDEEEEKTLKSYGKMGH